MFVISSVIFGIIELLVGMRFIFLFIGANPEAGFVAWVYALSAPFVEPFAGILGHPVTTPHLVGSVESVFDPSTLFALVVYAAIGGVLLTLLGRRG